MITVDVTQNSPEWFALKAGVPSTSSFDKIVTTKGVRSKSAEKYLHQLAGERITGIREEGYMNDAMRRGIELEPEAVKLYELITRAKTEEVGVCYQNEDKRFLTSPDRLIPGGYDGLLEIKCPLIQTHVKYLLDNKLPTDYFQQIQGQIFVTGAKYVDFMSYFPGLKPLIIRAQPDKEFLDKLKAEMDLFCTQLEDVVEKIK